MKKQLRANAFKRKVLVAPVKQEPIIICSDIEKIMFADFLKCLCYNDLSVLIVSGKPDSNQLFIAWITILSAHYTLIKSKEQLRHIKMVAKMEAINLKINVVTALCESLRLWYEPKLCDCLKMWGYKLPFPPETLLADIDRVLLELGNDRFQLEKIKLQYNADQKVKKKKGEIPTKDSYMRSLYTVEKHRGQRYPPDKITLYEFDMFCNELIEYNEAIKAQSDNLTYNKKRHATK